MPADDWKLLIQEVENAFFNLVTFPYSIGVFD